MLGDSDQTDPHNEKPLGRLIEDLRRGAGYTSQRTFHEATGISESMIAHVEAGRRLPSSKTLARMLTVARADRATRRRLEARLEQLSTSPLPTDLATLKALVEKMIQAQERQDEQRDRQLAELAALAAQLADRIDKLERRRGR